jgi:DNA mismatch repair ATPase MutS
MKKFAIRSTKTVISSTTESRKHRLNADTSTSDDEMREIAGEANETVPIVIMAFSYSHGVLGLACYDETRNCIMANSYELSTLDAEIVLTTIKLTLSPSLVLLHPNILANATLLSIILTGTNGEENYYSYKALKSTSWQVTNAIRIIYESLSIRRKTRGSSCIEGINLFNWLSRTIDMEKLQIQQAMVALLIHLQSTTFLLDNGKIMVTDIAPFPENRYLQMDGSSFRSLQIFCQDVHPNWIKGKGKNKEGFSLFALFDRTNSPGGRKKLRDMMMKPFAEKEKILARQEGVEFVVKDCNREFVKGVHRQLRHFADLPQLLIRMKKAESSFRDWFHLHCSMITGAKILQQLMAFSHSHFVDEPSQLFLQAIASTIDLDTIGYLVDRLSRVIDFAQSELHNEIVLLTGIDEILDQKRQLYDELETHLVQAARDILAEVPILEVRRRIYL